jgi:hypothetical protein
VSEEKYIGMNVHQATTTVALMDGQGKLIVECLLETKADTWNAHLKRVGAWLYDDHQRCDSRDESD